MAACCDPKGYDAVFGARFAKRVARRYRKRGLDHASSRMVSFLVEMGIEGATVLEIGGGVGEIQLELLRHGAARTTNLEIATGYEPEAARLIEQSGMTERVTRRLLDIAESPDKVEPADIVVLHRVVCCYPDYERLLSAAADHAQRLLVFSHPPRNVASRTFLWLKNHALGRTRGTFQAYMHPPEAMVAVLHQKGLQTRYRHRGPVWRVVGLER